MAVASTKSTSPPAPVTASPVATPGVAVRAADSWKNFWRPSASRTASRSILTGNFTVASLAAPDPAPLACAFAGLAFFELPAALAEAAALSSASPAAVPPAAFFWPSACPASGSDEAIRVAVLRRILPSSRSSWRTPASRVYSAITVRMTSSEIVTSSSRSPLRSR